ncbi:MAG: GIY-YIG nuclease family protein [Gaiellaceae bacterium]
MRQVNALVAWSPTPKPWLLEDELIGALDLPLNLSGNSGHPFWPTLTAVRAAAKASARELPIT